MSDEPVRLSAGGGGAPESLSKLLAEAKSDLPSSERLARVAAGLPLSVPPNAPPPAPPVDPTPASSLFGLGAAKTAAVVVAAAAIGAGAWWLTRAPESTPLASPPGVVTESAPVAIEDPPEQAPAPPRVVEPPSSAPAPSEKPAAKPAPAGPSEAALLRQAQAQLKSDPARALNLTREHRRRFPSGALAQEREVIAIEALSRLGRKSEAGVRADDFQKSYPGSAHKKKVQSAVEDDPR